MLMCTIKSGQIFEMSCKTISQYDSEPVMATSHSCHSVIIQTP